MKHTPEPWSLLSQRQDIIKGKDGSHILECIGHEANPRTQANAARIVQCVNACTGMEDPAKDIESMIRSAFMEGYNAGREDATESCEAKLDMLVNGNYAPKVDYSNAPTLEDYGITESDIIFNAEKHEGTNYLYKGESGYHGFKDKLSKEDMDKGGFLLIWERVSA